MWDVLSDKGVGLSFTVASTLDPHLPQAVTLPPPAIQPLWSYECWY